MILIDTHVVSELCRHRPAPAVERRAAVTEAPFGTSVVTIEEIHFGLSCKPNPRIETLLVRFFSGRCTTLPITEPVARRADNLRGQLRSLGRPRMMRSTLVGVGR